MHYRSLNQQNFSLDTIEVTYRKWKYFSTNLVFLYNENDFIGFLPGYLLGTLKVSVKDMVQRRDKERSVTIFV